MSNPVIIGNATLYLGDCRDILPTLPKVDACVTDPPYGIEGIVGGYGRDGRTIANDQDLTVCHAALSLARQQIDNGWIFAFYSARVSPEFFGVDIGADYFGEVIWDKRAPGMGGGLRYQHENIAVYKVGTPQNLKQLFSVISHYRKGVVHPHEKPIKLMRDLLEAIPAETILDPFMGSGTTGVAAVQLGRKFVGIEYDAEHFATACKRIAEAAADDAGDLFAMAGAA